MESMQTSYVCLVYLTIYLIHSASPGVAAEVFSNQDHSGMRLPWQRKSIDAVSDRPKVDNRQLRRWLYARLSVAGIFMHTAKMGTFFSQDSRPQVTMAAQSEVKQEAQLPQRNLSLIHI